MLLMPSQTGQSPYRLRWQPTGDQMNPAAHVAMLELPRIDIWHATWNL